jgi:predicted DNA-binding transcriptional regulator YafY
VRAGRLVALILAVEWRGGATARQLADELGVSERTIYRDVATLQAAGVPLWTETGPHGGVRLVDGWRSPVDGLTTSETTALLLGSSGAADLGLGSVLAAARSKLRSALPAGGRSETDRIRERFHLDAPGWFHHAEPLDALPVVAEALWADRRVDLRYRRGDRELRRRVDPLGLVLKAGTWYLVAAHRGDVRTYRVSRIAGATARDEPAVRPVGFDLVAHWEASADAFDASIRPLRVRVRLSPAALRGLLRAIPGPTTRAAVEAAGPPDADGWRELIVPLEPLPVAVTLLAPLHGVEVLAPDELRAAVASHGRSLAARNA